MLSDLDTVKIGAAAPDFTLRGARGELLASLSQLRGRPAVLAFADGWDASQSPGQLETIRAELRALGAVLLVVSSNRVLGVRADDDHAELSAIPEGALRQDVTAVARRYGVAGARGHIMPALLVVDREGIVRFARAIADDGPDLTATVARALGVAGRAIALGTDGGALVSKTMDESIPAAVGMLSRRDVLISSLAFGLALALVEACGSQQRPAVGGALPAHAEPAPGEIPVTLNVNGVDRQVNVDVRTTLLDALRERLFLTGAKKGCDMGQCGACTVLVDGRRINACLALAVMQQGAKITTIEGLSDGALHPVQAAFVAEDGFQCGYCTSGQIMSAVALLSEGRRESDTEVREHMSGNICRCGAYPNIVAAIQRARRGA